MYHRPSIRYACVLMCIISILIISCSGPFSQHPAQESTSTPSSQIAATGVVNPSPAIDSIATQVLLNMHQHSWNANAVTRGQVTGGLFINWKMGDPAITNAVTPGADGNPQHNHDTQVDLLYLNALAEYHQLHPQDHTFDADIAHTTTVVLTDFKSYSLPKGWIYFYILRSGLLLQNTALVDESHAVAGRFFSKWYDPHLGFVYDRSHTPGDYSTDHTINCGAALIDAGTRWNQPDWVNAGEKTIDHTLAVGLDPHYHLFYSNMIVGDNGQDSVQNYQLKPSTQGQAVDALVSAYTITHNQHYLDVSQQILQSLFGASGLWDTARGGFFFAVDVQKGKLLKDYKETRSQSLVLIAVHHYNQIQQHPLTQDEQELLSVFSQHFYQSTYHGFFYRVAPDFQVYVSRPGQGIGVEDYFTTEAMGSSLDALQQTELK